MHIYWIVLSVYYFVLLNSNISRISTGTFQINFCFWKIACYKYLSNMLAMTVKVAHLDIVLPLDRSYFPLGKGFRINAPQLAIESHLPDYICEWWVLHGKERQIGKENHQMWNGIGAKIKNERAVKGLDKVKEGAFTTWGGKANPFPSIIPVSVPSTEQER